MHDNIVYMQADLAMDVNSKCILMQLKLIVTHAVYI